MYNIYSTDKEKKKRMKIKIHFSKDLLINNLIKCTSVKNFFLEPEIPRRRKNRISKEKWENVQSPRWADLSQSVGDIRKHVQKLYYRNDERYPLPDKDLTN